MKTEVPRIGIIDGGVDLEHPAIARRIPIPLAGEHRSGEPSFLHYPHWNFESNTFQQFDPAFYNQLSEKNKANYEYYYGHGTAVANVILRCMPAAEIHTLKMPFDFLVDDDQVVRTPVSWKELLETAEQKEAAKRNLFNQMKQFILQHRIPIVNCSWTETASDKANELRAKYPCLDEEQLTRLTSLYLDGIARVHTAFFSDKDMMRSTLFVIAAGNQNIFLHEVPVYPAILHYPHTITVGGTTSAATWWTDREDFGSNYGYKHVDISTQAKTFRVAWGRDVVKVKSGTSLATPIVSALSLKLLLENPTVTPTELKDLVLAQGRQREGLRERVAEGRYMDAHAHFPEIAQILTYE